MTSTKRSSVQIPWWLGDDGAEVCVFCHRKHPWEDRRHCALCDVSLCCLCVERPEFHGVLLCPRCIAAEREAR